MRVERGRLPRRARRVFNYCRSITRLRRVMNDARELAFGAAAEQRLQDLRMQTMKTRRGQRIFHRSPCELMTKTNHTVVQRQYSACDTFFERGAGWVDAFVE